MTWDHGADLENGQAVIGVTDVRRVAIWGSCVTRDAFALVDEPDASGPTLDLVYYGARSSWVSQGSVPWSGGVDMGDLSGFGRRMVTEDLDKTIPKMLVESAPDLVVFDLIDERLPLLRRGSTWVTLSDYLMQTPMAEPLKSEAVERSGLSDPRRRKMFGASARAVGLQLLRALPRATFVLHAAPYTTRVDGGGQLPEPAAGWARELEQGQQPLFDLLREALGPRLVVLRPPEELSVADPNHRWGLSSYHYAEGYYRWLIRELLDVPLSAAAESSLADEHPGPEFLRRIGTLRRRVFGQGG
jgi:hypothetical protein